jgi:putative ABC transport system permease protein
MLKNYLKTAWRNLLHNKTFSLINIFGLTLGMTCSLLIMLWLKDELKKDKFHQNDKRLYRVMENQYYSGDISTFPSTPGILAENIVKDIPEIQMASQMLWEEQPLFTVGNIFNKEKGRHVQKDFLKMFSFKLSKGDAATALVNPDAIVISKKIAEKYFKGEDPIGKMIRVDNKDNAMVTGVLEEIPELSSLKFDFLLNYEHWFKQNDWAKEWDNNGPRCYVMLAANTSVDKVNAKIKNYIKTKKKDSNVELFLQNYGESYLYSDWDNGKQHGGRIEHVRIFSIVAIIILLIACINFMNLATARSLRRAREIGVRKVVGAGKRQLIAQFIGESLFVSFIAVCLSLIIVALSLPGFNTLTEKNLSIDLNPSFLLLILGLTLVTGIISGSYPALFMSSLKPIIVLKGILKFKSGATYFRKALVVFQFALSIILILGMIVIYRQINYIHNKNLGFAKADLLYMPLEGELQKDYPAFKDVLLTQPGIKYVSSAQSSPLEVGSSTQGVRWPGKDTTQLILFSNNPITYDYIKTMGIQLIAGRDFDRSYGLDSMNYLVNEAAAKKIGYKDPVGKELTMWGNKGTIIGLMKDYHHNSLHVPIEPLILFLHKKSWGGTYWGNIIVKTEQGKTKQAIASMEKVYKQFNPGFPFKYYFTDDEIANTYKAEHTVSKLSRYFAFLAIFISCLGLFGLVTFTAEQKTKEIGIRKVLGASVTGIVRMLSKDFLKLVLIAAIIAFPIAWWAMHRWLNDFEYRVDIGWWVFVVAGVAAILIALVTISFQSIKAAIANPVKSLRTE